MTHVPKTSGQFSQQIQFRDFVSMSNVKLVVSQWGNGSPWFFMSCLVRISVQICDI